MTDEPISTKRLQFLRLVYEAACRATVAMDALFHVQDGLCSAAHLSRTPEGDKASRIREIALSHKEGIESMRTEILELVKKLELDRPKPYTVQQTDGVWQILAPGGVEVGRVAHSETEAWRWASDLNERADYQ